MLIGVQLQLLHLLIRYLYYSWSWKLCFLFTKRYKKKQMVYLDPARSTVYTNEAGYCRQKETHIWWSNELNPGCTGMDKVQPKEWKWLGLIYLRGHACTLQILSLKMMIVCWKASTCHIFHYYGRWNSGWYDFHGHLLYITSIALCLGLYGFYILSSTKKNLSCYYPFSNNSKLNNDK